MTDRERHANDLGQTADRLFTKTCRELGVDPDIALAAPLETIEMARRMPTESNDRMNGGNSQ